MPALSTPVASACISVLFLLGTLSAQTASQAAPAPEASQVRIVRLSQVKGVVQLDRNTGRGFEPAIANLPIVEHSRLQTGMGIAEVEFEDNSTLRIAPGSLVEFTQLGRLPQGSTISSVRLVKGTAYISLLKTRGPEFNLLFGQQKLQLPPASHIRLQTDGSIATLAVLDGTLRLDDPANPTEVPHKNTITFNLLDQSEPTFAKNIVPAAMDAWDKNSAQAHSQSAATTAFGSPYAYGLGDMMYYGAFTSAGACGSMWRPYFASAAWDPYSNGVWAWYQGAGYSWVSPYPWGWTPYHFGNWSYCAGTGWGWQPGGSWNGLNNLTAVVPAGGGGAVGAHPIPPRPVRPPSPGSPTLTAFNRTSPVRSEVAGDSFVFRRDSAGLGIPRDGLGKLNKLSQNTLTRGTATTPIYITRPSSYAGNERPGNERSGNERPGNERPANGRPASGTNGATNEGFNPGSIHRGSAPPPETQRPSGGWGGNGAGNGAGNAGGNGSGNAGGNGGGNPGGYGGGYGGGGGNSPRSGPEPGNQGARSAPSSGGQSAPSSSPAANSGASRPR